MRMQWTTQNEATGADGFLLEGEAELHRGNRVAAFGRLS